jgi:hypothetical protein
VDWRAPNEVIATASIQVPLLVLENATDHRLPLVAYVAQAAIVLVLVFAYFALLEAIQSAHVCLHELLDEDDEAAS